MPNLSTGQSASGSCVYSDSISVEASSGYAQFESPSGTILAQFTGRRTFGPFNNQSFTVRSLTGNIYYEFSDGFPSGTFITPVAAVSQSGLLTGLVNPVDGSIVPLGTTVSSGGGTSVAFAGTALTLNSGDSSVYNGNTLICTNAATQTITIASGANLAAGFWVEQLGAGVVTITAGSGVTVNAPGGASSVGVRTVMRVVQEAVDVYTVVLPNTGSGDMVLSGTQTVSGPKTFNTGTMKHAGATSGTTTLQASAVASGTLTLPAATDTLVGQSTTDTLSNKTLVVPALGTPASGTLSNCTSATQSQGDNSTKLATTAYVDTGLGNKAPFSSYTLTTSTAITHAAHANRIGFINQPTATTMTFAGTATSGAVDGDVFVLVNRGAGVVTAAGTAAADSGFKLQVRQGETLSVIYNAAADAWYTTTPDYNAIQPNSQSANYTTTISDAGRDIVHPSSDANARTFTIDSNANVPHPVGTCIGFLNMSANVVTIAIATDTLTFLPGGTTGSRSLAQYGRASAKKISSTTWAIDGNSALT